MDKFKDKVIIITGVSEGIGRAPFEFFTVHDLLCVHFCFPLYGLKNTRYFKLCTLYSGMGGNPFPVSPQSGKGAFRPMGPYSFFIFSYTGLPTRKV